MQSLIHNGLFITILFIFKYSRFPVKDKPKSRQKGTTNSLKLRLILSVFQMAEEGYPMPLVDSDNPSYNPYKEFLFTSDSYDEVIF